MNQQYSNNSSRASSPETPPIPRRGPRTPREQPDTQTVTCLAALSKPGEPNDYNSHPSGVEINPFTGKARVGPKTPPPPPEEQQQPQSAYDYPGYHLYANGYPPHPYAHYYMQPSTSTAPGPYNNQFLELAISNQEAPQPPVYPGGYYSIPHYTAPLPAPPIVTTVPAPQKPPISCITDITVPPPPPRPSLPDKQQQQQFFTISHPPLPPVQSLKYGTNGVYCEQQQLQQPSTSVERIVTTPVVPEPSYTHTSPYMKRGVSKFGSYDQTADILAGARCQSTSSSRKEHKRRDSGKRDIRVPTSIANSMPRDYNSRSSSYGPISPPRAPLFDAIPPPPPPPTLPATNGTSKNNSYSSSSKRSISPPLDQNSSFSALLAMRASAQRTPGTTNILVPTVHESTSSSPVSSTSDSSYQREEDSEDVPNREKRFQDAEVSIFSSREFRFNGVCYSDASVNNVETEMSTVSMANEEIENEKGSEANCREQTQTPTGTPLSDIANGGTGFSLGPKLQEQTVRALPMEFFGMTTPKPPVTPVAAKPPQPQPSAPNTPSHASVAPKPTPDPVEIAAGSKPAAAPEESKAFLLQDPISLPSQTNGQRTSQPPVKTPTVAPRPPMARPVIAASRHPSKGTPSTPDTMGLKDRFKHFKSTQREKMMSLKASSSGTFDRKILEKAYQVPLEAKKAKKGEKLNGHAALPMPESPAEDSVHEKKSSKHHRAEVHVESTKPKKHHHESEETIEAHKIEKEHKRKSIHKMSSHEEPRHEPVLHKEHHKSKSSKHHKSSESKPSPVLHKPEPVHHHHKKERILFTPEPEPVQEKPEATPVQQKEPEEEEEVHHQRVLFTPEPPEEIPEEMPQQQVEKKPEPVLHMPEDKPEPVLQEPVLHRPEPVRSERVLFTPEPALRSPEPPVLHKPTAVLLTPEPVVLQKPEPVLHKPEAVFLLAPEPQKPEAVLQAPEPVLHYQSSEPQKPEPVLHRPEPIRPEPSEPVLLYKPTPILYKPEPLRPESVYYAPEVQHEPEPEPIVYKPEEPVLQKPEPVLHQQEPPVQQYKEPEPVLHMPEPVQEPVQEKPEPVLHEPEQSIVQEGPAATAQQYEPEPIPQWEQEDVTFDDNYDVPMDVDPEPEAARLEPSEDVPSTSKPLKEKSPEPPVAKQVRESPKPAPVQERKPSFDVEVVEAEPSISTAPPPPQKRPIVTKAALKMHQPPPPPPPPAKTPKAAPSAKKSKLKRKRKRRDEDSISPSPSPSPEPAPSVSSRGGPAANKKRKINGKAPPVALPPPPPPAPAPPAMLPGEEELTPSTRWLLSLERAAKDRKERLQAADASGRAVSQAPTAPRASTTAPVPAGPSDFSPPLPTSSHSSRSRTIQSNASKASTPTRPSTAVRGSSFHTPNTSDSDPEQVEAQKKASVATAAAVVKPKPLQKPTSSSGMSDWSRDIMAIVKGPAAVANLPPKRPPTFARAQAPAPPAPTLKPPPKPYSNGVSAASSSNGARPSKINSQRTSFNMHYDPYRLGSGSTLKNKIHLLFENIRQGGNGIVEDEDEVVDDADPLSETGETTLAGVLYPANTDRDQQVREAVRRAMSSVPVDRIQVPADRLQAVNDALEGYEESERTELLEDVLGRQNTISRKTHVNPVARAAIKHLKHEDAEKKNAQGARRGHPDFERAKAAAANARNYVAVTNRNLMRLAKKCHLPILSEKYRKFIRVVNDPKGGAPVLSCDYTVISKHFTKPELHIFFREFNRLAACQEENGVAVFPLTVVHCGGMELNNELNQMLAENENLMVKIGCLTNKQLIETMRLRDYYDRVADSNWKGTFCFGPMMSCSLVGTKQEEAGNYFPSILKELEDHPFTKTILPWGDFAYTQGTKATDSDDGPIIWVRPGEQMVPTDYLKKDWKTFKKASKEPYERIEKKGATRQMERRDFEFFDRTNCHADHVEDNKHGRIRTAAVGILQAVRPPFDPEVDDPEDKEEQFPEERPVLKEAILFHAASFDKVVDMLAIDLYEPPVNQCTKWVEDSMLNQMRREGVLYTKYQLREGDMYFIPRDTVHQFKTTNACVSLAWHSRLSHYYLPNFPNTMEDPEHQPDDDLLTTLSTPIDRPCCSSSLSKLSSKVPSPT